MMQAVGTRKRRSNRARQGNGLDPNALLSLEDAAREFKVSVRTLQRYCKQGRLPAIREGRRILVRRQDVERSQGWNDHLSLLRTLLAAKDSVPLSEWMDGWRQLTRLTSDDPAAAAAWIAWADEAVRRHPGFRVGDYRVHHLVQSAEHPVRHEHVDHMVHAMQRFPADAVARDALRTFHNSVAPWTRS